MRPASSWWILPRLRRPPIRGTECGSLRWVSEHLSSCSLTTTSLLTSMFSFLSHYHILCFCFTEESSERQRSQDPYSVQFADPAEECQAEGKVSSAYPAGGKKTLKHLIVTCQHATHPYLSQTGTVCACRRNSRSNLEFGRSGIRSRRYDIHPFHLFSSFLWSPEPQHFSFLHSYYQSCFTIIFFQYLTFHSSPLIKILFIQWKDDVLF